MAIDDKHSEYEKYSHRWDTSRAVIGGEDVVKGLTGDYKPTDFLPGFYPEDWERYKWYVQRAVFIAYTAFTHTGLLGSVFRKDPDMEFPETIEYIEKNINGKAQGIKQFAKRVVSENLEVGRVGIFVDYPNIEEEGRTGEEQATVNIYTAESILDWKTETINNQLVLTMVVLLEHDPIIGKQYRVLIIENGVYYQRIYDEDEDLISEYQPRNFKGELFTYIPFQFCGSKDNTPSVDKPPLLDIAFVNKGHYRNSADHEENLHVHGQGTLLLWSDLSAEEWKTANPNGVNVGARAGHFLGQNGGGELLQLRESQAYQVAMDKKVIQMIGIGARFIQESAGNQRVDAVKMDKGQKESGLITLVDNCESAMINAIKFIIDFMSGEELEYKFELNRDFYDTNITAQEKTAMIMLVDSGVMPKSDARTLLKKAGWIAADKTEDEIEAEIETDISINE